jgi:hypothetical protein
MGNAIDLHARSSRNRAGNGRKNGLSAGFSDFRSLHGDIVISGASVSGDKNPVPDSTRKKVREGFGALSHSEMP